MFPAVCLHCHTRISEQSLWLCGACTEKLSYLPEVHCPVCGYPDVEGQCFNCAENHYVFTQALSVFLYDGAVKTLVHELKYSGYPDIAVWFANELFKLIQREKTYAEIDCLVAIPLHRVKKRERGYNQSELIARALADKLMITYSSKMLLRKTNTVSQTLLDGTKRRQNLGNAFSTGRENPAGKDILIIDDVFTTGTTVNEAAKVLKAAGAKRIFVLTVCHGL